MLIKSSSHKSLGKQEEGVEKEIFPMGKRRMVIVIFQRWQK